MSTEPKVVHSFAKNQTEEIRVSVNRYKGKSYLDLRVFYEASDGEYKPSKKGITIPPDLLSELEAGVRKLREEVGED